MLVLSRRRDESIIIGDNIVITIVEIRGDKVRLGIDAPRNVTVHRQEVYEAIQVERKEVEGESQLEQEANNSHQPSGGTPDSVTEYHNIFSQSPNLSNHYLGFELSGSYKSLKNELAYHAGL